MIELALDKNQSILVARPRAALEPGDFLDIAKTVDPYILETGKLNGLVIDAPTFPGWENLSAMAAHFRFVREHQKHIGRVALVTDSMIGNLAQSLASHFIAAQIRRFPAGDLEAATLWAASSN